MRSQAVPQELRRRPRATMAMMPTSSSPSRLGRPQRRDPTGSGERNAGRYCTPPGEADGEHATIGG